LRGSLPGLGGDSFITFNTFSLIAVRRKELKPLRFESRNCTNENRFSEDLNWSDGYKNLDDELVTPTLGSSSTKITTHLSGAFRCSTQCTLGTVTKCWENGTQQGYPDHSPTLVAATKTAPFALGEGFTKKLCPEPQLTQDRCTGTFLIL
jgi:hypothetical protein